MLLECTHCDYNVCLLYFRVSAVDSVFSSLYPVHLCATVCIAMACVSTMQCLDLCVALHCIAGPVHE